MPKQLNVNLAFTADTSAAKQQIKALEQDLKNLVSASGSTKDLKLTKDLVQAKEAAGQLRLALQNATTSTGSLDLTKFDQSIKASGMKLSEYRQRLSSLGPEGQQAFAKLAQSIIQAEVPLRKTNALLDQFKTTLVNTARWQISSSILHGFMGALQGAYGYAQDLNQSLNNIRIVTGASVEEMSAFADRANKAAQALSTTTTAYTDAALIYYQQGIRDQEEIAGRTETTIKLANVSRQSAEEVSQEMTAIWNNFYDGSKSLEYYADAITALGATTASSSEEIATGLEKFAAISKTVGLSYEYATAALATITAQTRQSAETVGTGLRTLFSRLEGLKLGETLEDGVDLNKYSKALDAVGVKALDASGELRNMDDILNDLGSRWDELSKAQQVALAQTVGGVRQYTNLIALMDNWDKMQTNVMTAKGSEGTLQKQADIYAESWEAAQKRVKAAAQAIYSDLLDDKFFIKLTNGLADILQGIDNLIDGMGGLKTILPAIALLMSHIFGKQMAQSIDNMAFNMQRGTEKMKQQIDTQKAEAYNEASKMFQGSDTATGQAQEAALKGQLDLSYKLKEVAHNLTEEEIQRYQASIDTVSAIQDQVVELGKAADKAKETQKAQSENLVQKAIRSGRTIEDKQMNAGGAERLLSQVQKQIEAANKQEQILNKINNLYAKGSISIDQYKSHLENLKSSLAVAGFTEFSTTMQEVQKAIDLASSGSISKFEEQIQKLAQAKGFETTAYIDNIGALESMAAEYDWTEEEMNQFIQLVQDSINKGQTFKEAMNTAANSVNDLKTKLEATENAIKSLGTTGQTIVSVFQNISSIMMGVNALKGAFDTLRDPDATGWQKFSAILTGLSMGIPGLISGLGGLKKITLDLALATQAENLAQNENLIVKGLVKVATLLHIPLKKAEAVATTEAAGASMADAGAKEAEAVATGQATAANVGFLATAWPILATMLAIAAAIALVVFAVKGLINWYNKDANAAKNAETASQNLKEALQETQQAYENLKATIESYDKAYNAINTLQKGTEEWKNAIRESNIEALKLIDSLKLIKDADYTIDKDGIIRIDQDALEAALEEKGQAVDAAQARSSMMDQTAKQARAQSNLTDLKRSDNTEADGLIDYAVKRLTSGDLAEAFRNNNLTDEELKQQLYIEDDDLIDSIKDLATTINQNTDMQSMTAEEIVRASVNNKEIGNSENREDIVKIAGKIYDQTYGKKYTDYLAQAQDRNWLFATGTKDAKEAMAAYEKELGLKELKGYQVENYKRDGSVEYSYIDEEGKRQTKEATAEEIAATLAVADANNELEKTASAVTSQLQQIERTGGAASDALKDFVTNENFYSSTKGDIEAVQKVGDASKYLGSTIGDANGTLTDEEAQALGFESAKAMVNSFEEGVQKAKEDWESLDLDSMGISGQEWAEGLSLETAKALQETLTTINLGPAGKAAGKSFVEGLNTLLEDVSKEDQQAVLDQLMNVDWSSWDALEQAKDVMAEFGYEIDTSSEYWQKFAAEMRTATNAKQDFDDLKGTLNDISKILQSLDFGKVISDEDYQRLIAYNKEWEKFFQLQADGTRKFIGDSQQMQAAMQDDLKSQIQTARENQKIQEGVKDSWAGSANFDAMSGKNTHMAEKLAGANGPVEDMLNQLGYSDEVIEKLIQDVSAGAEGAEDRMKEMYSRIAEYQTENFDTMDQEFQEMLASTATNVAQLQDMLQEGYIGIDDYSKGLSSMAMDASLNAPDLTSLQNGIQALGGSTTFGEGDNAYYDEYAQGLQRIASQYESCSEAAANYQYALTALEEATSDNKEALEENVRNAEEHLEVMVSCEEAAKQYGLESKTLAAQMREISKEEKVSEKAALAMAVANERMNKGVSQLNKNWSTWKKTLKSTEKTSEDYADTLVNVSEAVTELVGWYKDLNLDSKFVEKNMGLIDKAAEGDVTSILELGAAVAQLEIAESELNTTIAEGAMADGGQNAFQEWSNSALSAQENFDNLKDSLGGAFSALQSNMASIEAGTPLSEAVLGGMSVEEFVSELNAYAQATGMTATQMQSMLSSVGVTANVESDYQEQKVTVPTYREEVTAVNYRTLEGESITGTGESIPTHVTVPEYTKATIMGPPLETTGYVEVASISMDEGKGAPTFTGRQAPSSSSTGGGGGGCFIAGTLISTIEGFKPIEMIEPGDAVLSYNEATKKNEYSSVLQTMIHQVNEDIYSIYIDNEILQATGIHRFYIKRAGLAQWIPASGLRADDLMYFASGIWQPIKQIIKEQKETKVYNFEVSNNHNYYVGNARILAHNKGSCFVSGTLVTTDKGFKNIEDIQAGDIVLSYNEQIKQNVYSEVVQTMFHYTAERLYTLYIENEILKVTGIHRFYINRNNQLSWIHTQDLQVGDLVLFANGSWHEILKIESEFKFKKVYNFEVSNTHNYYVGENQILAHNKGGGGRTPKRVEARKEAHKPRQEAERYHVINNQIETLGKQLTRIDTLYERAFGSQKLELLDKQINKQKQLIGKQKEYIKEIEKNLKLDKKNLQSKGKKQYWSETDQKLKTVDTSAEKYLGMSVKFDKNGDILNYDKLMEENDKMYNKAVDEFNRKDADLVEKINDAYAAGKDKQAEKLEKEREKLQGIIEQAEAQHEGFIENLEQYEETYDLYLDQQQQLLEKQIEYFNKKLEKVDLKVQLKIDVSDDSLKLIDFMLERIQDDAYEAANRISLIGEKADESLNKINAARGGLKGIFKNHGIDFNDTMAALQKGTTTPEDVVADLLKGDNTLTEDEITKMREYMDILLEEATNLAEYRLQVIDEIGVVMDANMEKIDRTVEKMDHLKNVANSYKNIVDLTGRSYLKINAAMYDQIEQTNVGLAKQSLSMAKQNKDFANQQLAQVKAAYKQAKDEMAAQGKHLSKEEKNRWKEQIQQAEDYAREMTENYYSSWEEALEAVNTRFDSMMQNMSEDFSKSMAGLAGNLEGLKQRMDLRKKVQEVYLPEYEKVYQLTKLTRDAQKQIDESTNVKVKQELQKVQEEIVKAQEKGNKVSQYEVDYLQKELELKMAQLALEEAAQVKSQVRMTRDNEGNFSYVYTADDSKVKEAEDNYANKLYEMQKLNEEYIQDVQDQLVDLEMEYTQALQEAADIYGRGTKEYYKAVEAINKEYDSYFNSLTGQLDLALTNQKRTAEEHAATYVRITGDVNQANVNLTDSWDKTNLKALTGYENLKKYQDDWAKNSTAAAKAATNAGKAWEKDMSDVYKAAGEDINKFKGDVEGDSKAITKALGKIETKADKLMDSLSGEKGLFATMSKGFEDTLTAVVNWEKEYSAKIQKAINKNKKLVKSINDIIAAASDTKKKKTPKKDDDDTPKDDTPKDDTPKDDTPKDEDKDKDKGKKKMTDTLAEKIAAVIWMDGSHGWGNGPTRLKRIKKKFKNGEKAYNKVQDYLNAHAENGDIYDKYHSKEKRKELKKYRYSKFDTGGYTGDWIGPEGKMAMLHSKELVLNKDDTKNMLSIVGMVRDIAKTIELNAMSAGSGLSALSAPGVKSANSILDQNVHITAEFPNATDRQEILAAFDNVINLASQYANRK